MGGGISSNPVKWEASITSLANINSSHSPQTTSAISSGGDGNVCAISTL